MAKKQFKAESKRLLDLMINSIYTNKEIFLRELISNASDAMDKLAYRSLTDAGVGLNREDFKITLVADSEARTLTLSDNGIGMTREELEANLGTIAKSGSRQFKEEMAQAEGDSGDVDIIGQFGVGFYSAFMVADKITVTSRAYGSDEAWQWTSSGADGYTIVACDKEQVGTDIVMALKEDNDQEQYSDYLESFRIAGMVKKYSDYIRYPVVMEMERSRPLPRPADADENDQTQWESYMQWETLNSMVPLWQRPKSEVTEEEYQAFYKEKFADWEDPLAVVHTSAEGQVDYKAILYVPQKASRDFYTREHEKGLQLYSSGVLIMDKCADLIADHFRFVRGVVDTLDISLNISREMLQQTRQLKVIANNVEKKIKSELMRLQREDREKYHTFWQSFGPQIKYGVLAEYGAHKELLKDLLLFHSSREEEWVTLAEYVEKMPEDQPYIYYAGAESVAKAAKLPQAERILDKGYEVLYCIEEVDEFVIQALGELEGKQLRSVSDEDALPETEEEKEQAEQKTKDNQDVLSFVKETLGDKVSDVRISKILKSGAVCMTADGPITLEMEKHLNKVEDGQEMKAQRVLELNADAGAFAALRTAVDSNPERARDYAQLLYDQALLIAGLPLEDPAAYTALVCSLMQ